MLPFPPTSVLCEVQQCFGSFFCCWLYCLPYCCFYFWSGSFCVAPLSSHQCLAAFMDFPHSSLSLFNNCYSLIPFYTHNGLLVQWLQRFRCVFLVAFGSTFGHNSELNIVEVVEEGEKLVVSLPSFKYRLQLGISMCIPLLKFKWNLISSKRKLIWSDKRSWTLKFWVA